MPPQDKYQLIIQELVRRSNDEIRRLRELEQRIQIVENRSNTLENIFLEKTKKYEKKLAELDIAIKEFNDEVSRMKGIIDKVNKQMNKLARKREIRELEKMLELLTPEKGYVLKKEV